MDALLVILLFPAIANAGEAFNVTFRVTNTGTQTFNVSGTNAVRIGSQNPADNLTWGVSRVNLPANLAPNQTVDVQALFVAPAAGTYQFSWRMVQEQVAWFGNTVTQSVTVQGGPPPPPPSGGPLVGVVPPAPANGSLVSFIAMRTGPYSFTGHNLQSLTWLNNTNRTLEIHKAYLWTGVDIGGRGDVHLEAFRRSDSSLIGLVQWDHYAEPVAPTNQPQFSFDSPYMMLGPEDGIDIRYFNATLVNADHWIILWVRYQ